MKAHLRATRGAEYRRPGGPWDTESLDTLLRATTIDPPRPSGGSAEVLRDGESHLHGPELETMVAALAGGLRDLGVGRRDVVAWQLLNGYEAALLYRACWRLGAIAAPIPHGATEADAATLVDMVEPIVVVASAALSLGHRPGTIVVGGPSLPARRSREAEPVGPVTGLSPPFAKLLTAEAERRCPASPADVAAVFFDRRDGAWRGIVHTHRTLAARVGRSRDRLAVTAADTTLGAAPLWHIEGLVHGLLVPGVTGARNVLVASWNTEGILDLIERERVSVLSGPIAALDALIRDPDFATRRVRSIRRIATFGPGAARSFLAEAASACEATVVHGYGSTEAPDVAVATFAPGDFPAFSVARSDPDTELRVVDPVSGRDRAPGEEGELWVRGPQLFGGYVDELDTKAVMARGGWYRTGDLAATDQSPIGGSQMTDGPPEIGVIVGGRGDGTAVRAGRSVPLALIEAALSDHPAIERAVVVAIPDPVLGERIVAVVVATSPVDLRTIRSWWVSQGGDRADGPDEVLVVDDEAIPRDPAERTILRHHLS